ncbi:MAG TPA: glycosyltransferase family A protein [Devosiaceae bacterium]|jgi:glycosyltransferase involved in cell wall biosynthesis|nr:glycosyltransferase family A protein [Devosiaceae bacterium]
MDEAISVVMPAFRAEPFIATAVASVIGQSYPHWQLWIVSDDGLDYERVLGTGGLRDPRIRFLSTGGTATGASRARNLALDRIETPWVAILDADDSFLPQKLARAAAALAQHPVVSCALDVVTESGRPLRQVGTGPDRLLAAAEYKFVNLSMDSMILWDRRRADARYDPDLSNMTDLELLLQLWQRTPGTWHLGTPLHRYAKLSGSMSNSAGTTAGMIASKTALLQRLRSGHYRLPDAAVVGVARFLELSLAAEQSFPAALAAQPGLLFEDHLEPLLRAASTASA